MDCCGSSLGGAVARTVGGCGLSICARVVEILMTCQSEKRGADLRLAEAAQASRHHFSSARRRPEIGRTPPVRSRRTFCT